MAIIAVAHDEPCLDAEDEQGDAKEFRDIGAEPPGGGIVIWSAAVIENRAAVRGNWWGSGHRSWPELADQIADALNVRGGCRREHRQGKNLPGHAFGDRQRYGLELGFIAFLKVDGHGIVKAGGDAIFLQIVGQFGTARVLDNVEVVDVIAIWGDRWNRHISDAG